MRDVAERPWPALCAVVEGGQEEVEGKAWDLQTCDAET
jgi:hypothetical protein